MLRTDKNDGIRTLQPCGFQFGVHNACGYYSAIACGLSMILPGESIDTLNGMMRKNLILIAGVRGACAPDECIYRSENE